MQDEITDSYIEKKINFYRKYAKINRIFHVIFQTLIVIFVAITPIFAAIEGFSGKLISNGESGITYTLITSSILAILEGVSRLFRFRNLWLRYRNTCNQLNREKRKFNQRIGEYEKVEDPIKLLNVNVESIIEHEQREWLGSMKQE